MINNLRRITTNLYRGSAPSPKDVLWLKKNLKINKIISLDEHFGKIIDKTTRILGIKHLILPIDGNNKKTLLNLFSHNLKHLLLDDGPTYIHCHYGKDRTGLVAALFKCKYMGMSPDDAIKEAKSLGFGVNVDPKITHLYEKLIKTCKPEQDVNNADIVSNEREYKGDYKDTYLDEGRQCSFSPYLIPTKQNPFNSVYNTINDQSPTRENYEDYKSIKEHKEKSVVPLIGLFNNDAGIAGAGPTLNYTGFIYD